MLEDDANKRSIARQPVLKTAKIHFAHSIYDCLVLDLSATGVRISTAVPVSFPPEVSLELRTGATWVARLRWNRGTEAGFELLRFGGLNDETSLRAAEMLAAFCNSSDTQVLNRLAAEDYFGSPELRSTVETFARARDAVEQAFRHVLKQP